MRKLSRREFAKTCGLGGLSLAMASTSTAVKPNLKIDRIDLFPLTYPTVMRFKFFESPSGNTGRASVVIKITASDGTVGWGQSVPVPRWSYETLESAVSTIEHYLKPVLIGMDPFDLDGVHAAMDREVANSFSTGAPITKAGIDLALHDLVGRALGKNVAELWGRALPDDLLLSWTLNPKTLDETGPIVAKGRERGYSNFNIKVAPDLAADIALCRKVKELAPDGFLWGDANGGYDLATALEAARKLADAGMVVFEQPLPSNRLTGYQKLKKLGALPILMDEGVVSPSDLEEFIKLGCCDGVAMKPARCGGLVSARAQIELLNAHDLMFLGSGLTDPDISLAASLILYGAYGLQKPAALNGPQFLGETILKEPLVVKDGRIRIPKGPGLGVDVDEAKLTELSARKMS
jgi:L-alanine-DL-glutamate epimerase-like enolase superfamily enzyme